MITQANPKPRFLARTQPSADILPERDGIIHLQEQLTGPVPLRGERPAAELLAEALAEADPANPARIFIP